MGFASKSSVFGYFRVSGGSSGVYIYHFQTEFSKKTPDLGLSDIEQKLLKFWSTNFE